MEQESHRFQDFSRITDRLRIILGHLADVERRLQSQVVVPLEELQQAAQEVDVLQELPRQMGSQSGPWDVFYRKYSALLHHHLQAAGLRCDTPTPAAWDPKEAMQEMRQHFNESESKLRTVTFVRDLYQIVEQLEAGQQVSAAVMQPLLTQMEEMAHAVLDLAIDHPQLPAQFARVRQRLRAYLGQQSRERQGLAS